jgi:hypothetical protein
VKVLEVISKQWSYLKNFDFMLAILRYLYFM